MSYEDTKLIVQALSEHHLHRDPAAIRKGQLAYVRGTEITKAEPQRALVSFDEMRRQAAIEQQRESRRMAQSKRGRKVFA